MQIRIFFALVFIALVPMIRFSSRWLFSLALDMAGMTELDAARVRQEHMMSRRPQRHVFSAIVSRSVEKARTRRLLSLYTNSNFAVTAMSMVGCVLSLAATLRLFDKLLILLTADLAVVLIMTVCKAVCDIKHEKGRAVPVFTVALAAAFAAVSLAFLWSSAKDLSVVVPEEELVSILSDAGFELEEKEAELRAEKDGVLLQIYSTGGGEAATSAYNQVKSFVLAKGEDRTEIKKGNAEGFLVRADSFTYIAMRADRIVIYAGCTAEKVSEVEELLGTLGIKMN